MENTKKRNYPKIWRPIKPLREYLPIAIGGEAKSISKKEIKPGEIFAIQRADDDFLVYDVNSSGSHYFIGGVILAFALFFLLFDFNNEESPIFSLLVALFASFFILYGYTMPKKEIILDRQNGLFTYPGFMWGKPIAIPFKDAVVNLGAKGWPPTLSLNAFHPNGITSATITEINQLETWYLFVWYMDRNRPLPPGSAFDPYRQKDYERRKREGFPPPLYESYIETPEQPIDRSEVLPDPSTF